MTMELKHVILNIVLTFHKQRYKFVFLTMLMYVVVYIYNNRDNEFINPHKVKMGIKRRWSWLGNCDIVPEDWIYDKMVACEGNFIAYGHRFAVLRDVSIKPNLNTFFFSCDNLALLKQSYTFEINGKENYLNNWLRTLEVNVDITTSKTMATVVKRKINDKLSIHPSKTNRTIDRRVMFALRRTDLHNLYHTFTEFYNIVFICKLLNISTDSVHVLFYENEIIPGPHIGLWKKLFGNYTFLNNIKEETQFENMIWVINTLMSPIDFHCIKQPPFTRLFRDFMLQKFGVSYSKSLDCRNVSIFFIQRRDNTVEIHGGARNTSRKILNEHDLMKTVQNRYPNSHVTGFPLDGIDFSEQLKVITQTDILVGMHGAGMAHVLFLPSHAGVVEFFPTYFPKYPGRTYFQVWSKWFGLKYTSWQNLDPSNEFANMYTYIPPLVVETHINEIFTQLCPDMSAR